MSFTIGITGKGGVGKTTVSALIVSSLIRRKCTPVLAVDADPNTCLDEALGVRVVKSVGTVREEAKEIAGKGMASGVSKQEMLELKIAESLVEADDFDLIAMGRSEGPGCYCYANNVLKQTIHEVSDSYPYVVIDNEAGLENLSRRIVQKLDLLVMVADPSMRGLNTVRRLHRLTAEMKIEYENLALVINRTRSDEVPPAAIELGKEIGADDLIGIKENEIIAGLAEQGKSLTGLPESDSAQQKISGVLDGLAGGLPGRNR